MANKKLNAVITIGGAISGSFKTTIFGVKSRLGEVGKTVQGLTRRQNELDSAIKKTGSTGRYVTGLRNEYSRLTEQLDKARKAQDRLRRAAEKQEKARAIGGKLMGAGAVATAGAVAIGVTVRPLISAAIARENSVNAIRNSGVSKHDADAMIKAAERSRQFGVSVTKATDTVSELRTALGDAHHAIKALPTALKAISGLKLYDRLHHTDLADGDAAYNMAKVSEERGGASDPEAMRRKYNWAFKAVTGSNGKVSVGDLLNSVRAGKGAVQAMSDEAFFGDTFLQQAMGSHRYGTASSTWVNAWIGGHQTHGAFDHMLQYGLLNRKGVTFDKTGKVKTVAPDALVDSQAFLKDPQAWVDKHLVPLAKQRGVNMSDPAAIMQFANAIASNPNVATMILSRMRFSQNIWKDRRNVLMGNGIDASDQQNRNSTAGKEENWQARQDDAKANFGKAITPIYASVLDKAAAALERLNAFTEKHPTLAKAMVIGVVAVGGALAVVGGTLATVGIGLRAYAGYQALATTSSGVLGAATGALGTAFGFLGTVLGTVGRAMLLNPIGLAITLIAGGAYLIYRNWGPISGFFVDLWNKIKGPAAELWGWFKGAFLKYTPLGQVIANWGPISTFFKNLFDGIMDTAGKAIDWIVGKIAVVGDMWSKTKEFFGYGDTPAAAAGKPPVAHWPAQMGGRLAPAMPPMAAARGAGGTTIHDNSKTEINVHQQPGQDGKALAAEVQRQLAKTRRAHSGSQLYDAPRGY